MRQFNTLAGHLFALEVNVNGVKRPEAPASGMTPDSLLAAKLDSPVTKKVLGQLQLKSSQR